MIVAYNVTQYVEQIDRYQFCCVSVSLITDSFDIKLNKGALKMLDVKMTDQMTGHENAG